MAARMLIHVTISADAGPDALASVAGDRLLMYVLVHMLSRRFSGGLVLAAVALTVLGRGFSAAVSGPPPQATAVVRTADAPIILMGIGSQTTEVFYLSSGTYRSDWSAWGEAAEFPPCTHSAELMAVDPANAETSLGHVTDLAKHPHYSGCALESYMPSGRRKLAATWARADCIGQRRQRRAARLFADSQY